MTPSVDKAPPRPSSASQMGIAFPPDRSNFFSFPAAKNARNFPSGDQNGYMAASVPGRKRDPVESSERSHRPPVQVLPCVKAANAILLPSGEATGGPDMPRKL